MVQNWVKTKVLIDGNSKEGPNNWRFETVK